MSLTTFRRPCTQCSHIILPRRGFSSSPISRSPAWPWRRSPSSSPEWIREERRIYARPSQLRPKLLWVVVGIWTPLWWVCSCSGDQARTTRLTSDRFCLTYSFFVADNIRYSSTRSLEATSATTSSSSSASTAEAISATLNPLLATQSTKDSLIAGVLVTAGLILPALSLGFPTRVVTKMTQVRLRPAVSSLPSSNAVVVGKEVKKKAGEFEEFIEFETLSTQMWRGPWGRPRLIPRDDIKVVRTLRRDSKSKNIQISRER